jgi:hypothetical protein
VLRILKFVRVFSQRKILFAKKQLVITYFDSEAEIHILPTVTAWQ